MRVVPVEAGHPGASQAGSEAGNVRLGMLRLPGEGDRRSRRREPAEKGAARGAWKATKREDKRLRILNPVNRLSGLEIGKPRTIWNLTLVPLSGNGASPLDYLLLDDALLAEKVAVEEVIEGGSVPELRMANFSNRFVLVVDGTELVGGKRNRIVNASFLIPPESMVKIPVSDVGQERRSRNPGQEFRASRQFAPHSIRRENVAYQNTTPDKKRGYLSDQGKVWAHVAEMSQKLGIPTPTGSMNEVMERKQDAIDGYRMCMALEGTETGTAFFVNGIFRGIELFDRATTFKKMCPKLLSGIAVDAMMAQGDRPPEPRASSGEATEHVRRVLDEVGKSLFEMYDPVGAGEDLRYDAKLSFGKALQYGADLIHFSAFGK